MRYSLLAGGKRIRPVLALATAEALGRDPRGAAAGRRDRARPHLLADPRRPAGDGRRRPAPRPADLHVKYGEDVAILAGDGLFAEAMSLVPRAPGGRPEHVLAALAELTDATGVGGMVGGQYVDVTADGDLDAQGLRRLHELKTGG